MSELGDDVLSLENFDIYRLAVAGQFVYPSGAVGDVSELLGGDPWLTTPGDVALSLSVGAIGSRINAMYAGAIEPEVAAPDLPDDDR